MPSLSSSSQVDWVGSTEENLYCFPEGSYVLRSVPVQQSSEEGLWEVTGSLGPWLHQRIHPLRSHGTAALLGGAGKLDVGPNGKIRLERCTFVPSAFRPLLPSKHGVNSFAPCPSAMMICLTITQKQWSQPTMDWTIWNCEPRGIFPLISFSYIWSKQQIAE